MHHHTYKPEWPKSVLPMAAACLLATACVLTAGKVVVIHESSRGSVYLEQIPDRSFHTAHPISLEPAAITRVLRGVLVQEQQRLLQTLFAGEPNALQVFSDEDIAFLTPLIATALSQAAFDERVRFRVLHRTDSGPESTEGALFAYGRSLHLTLTHYRYNPVGLNTDSKPRRTLPDPSGFSGLHVLFVPEAALRPDVYQSTALLDESPMTTLVIDYDLLNTIPSAHQEPASAATSQPEKTDASNGPTRIPPPANSRSTRSSELEVAAPEELRAIKDLVIKKDVELEALREELRSLRRQLTEREAELQKPKGKKKPVPQSQDTSP